MLSICGWKSQGSQLLLNLYLLCNPTTILNNAEYIDSVISFSSLTWSNSQNQPSTSPTQPSSVSQMKRSLLDRLASKHPTYTSSLSNPQLPALSQNCITKSHIAGARCVFGHYLSARRLRMMLRHLMRWAACLLLLSLYPPMQCSRNPINSSYSCYASSSSPHSYLTCLLKLIPLNNAKFSSTSFPSAICQQTFLKECCSTSISYPINNFLFIAKYYSSYLCRIYLRKDYRLAMIVCINYYKKLRHHFSRITFGAFGQDVGSSSRVRVSSSSSLEIRDVRDDQKGGSLPNMWSYPPTVLIMPLSLTMSGFASLNTFSMMAQEDILSANECRQMACPISGNFLPRQRSSLRIGFMRVLESWHRI